jgi:hypothetical protein
MSIHTHVGSLHAVSVAQQSQIVEVETLWRPGCLYCLFSASTPLGKSPAVPKAQASVSSQSPLGKIASAS